MAPYDFIISGLALDLVGSVVLAKGFMLKRAKEIWRESRTHAGANSFYVKGGLQQRGEALVGGSLLVVGFASQMWGNFHDGPAANDLGWINSAPRLGLLALGVAALAGVGLWAAHRWAHDRFCCVFFRAYDVSHPPPALEKGHGDDWDGLAWLYGTARRGGETDDQLVERLEGMRKELGPKYGRRVGA